MSKERGNIQAKSYSYPELINFLKKNGAIKKEYFDKIKTKNIWYCPKFVEPVIERSNTLFKREKAEFDVETQNN